MGYFPAAQSPEHLEANHNRNTGDHDTPTDWWASYRLECKELTEDIQRLIADRLAASKDRADELPGMVALDIEAVQENVTAALHDALNDASSVPLD